MRSAAIITETFVALLHSIGIGGGRRLRMADWRAMLKETGFGNPRTLIATGNAIFESEKAEVQEIEDRLETAFNRRFGRHVDTIVCGAAAFQQLARENPFPKESRQDGSRVLVRVMREPLGEIVKKDLQPYLAQRERLRVVHGHLWVHFKHEPNRSRLMPILGSKRLGIGTVRNWNTVRRLDEMLGREHGHLKSRALSALTGVAESVHARIGTA
jgi:uncharacterized protein (DUF1697 family)